jgi:hypothetical protein
MKTVRALQAHEIELIAGGRKPDPELTDHPQPILTDNNPYDIPSEPIVPICPANGPELGTPA